MFVAHETKSWPAKGQNIDNESVRTAAKIEENGQQISPPGFNL